MAGCWLEVGSVKEVLSRPTHLRVTHTVGLLNQKTMNQTVVEPNFQLQEFPLNCEKCERLGYIFVEDLNEPIFVICQKCSGETSNVWCPKCEMGGSFVQNINQHPTAWSCPNCHTKYSLPLNFYDKPVALLGIEELPQAIQERIKSAKEATRPKFSAIGFLLIFPYIVIVLALLLWPFGLGFWFFVRTHNPIWLILGIAVLFVWLRFGRPVLRSALAWLSEISKKVNAM